ncbi:MAG: nitroreductase, partial [Lewinella sp.]|nr:nitroreductase [Lewinella sp.]
MSKLPSPSETTALLRARRSVFPSMYTDEPVAEHIIREMLENANWAPNHKQTEPWRFKVFRGEALQRLGAFLGERYEATTPPERFSGIKQRKLSTNPAKAGALIAIILHRDPEARLPEWEEIAAVAAAVQNMWLTATAHGLGGYWSSPNTITEHAADFLQLAEGER